LPAGAPEGNHNATKNRQWRGALDRAIATDNGKRLRAAAEQLLNKAEAGEPWAIKEIADRLDGKPHQSVELTADVTNRASSLTDDQLAEIARAGNRDKT
jgi:hypothetical protein